MTRVQFLNDLYHHLYGMTKEQVEQHLTYYAEMLADRMEEGMSEEEAVAGMEDVETIARRILEEEGLPYTPPDQRPVTPPAYPDASRLGGGGGGARAYQVPKRFGWRKALHISVWAVALAIAVFAAIGAVGRWRWNHYAGDYATESTPVPDWDTGEESLVEDTGWGDMDYLETPYYEGFEYSEGETYFDAQDITAIDIQWSAGTVFIQSWSESNFMVQEYAENELSERTRMETSLVDGVLTVRYRSNVGIGNVKGQKWLTVLVPEGLMSEISVNTASAAVQMNGLEADTLRALTISGDVAVTGCYAQASKFSSTSGCLRLRELEADRVEASTVSGDIDGIDLWSNDTVISSTSGYINLSMIDDMESIEVRSVSGDIWIWAAESIFQEIAVGSTSGDISISLPINHMGFTLDFNTVSGDLDVPGETTAPSSKNGTYVYEDGSCKITAETVSGNLRVY